ncbi:MAG TPA: hypothetical protein ENI60_09835 [Candidatus Fraserbacteria bacterium]|nr:hypothetical protein [Candidatus Fraserbacteria bacterium]
MKRLSLAQLIGLSAALALMALVALLLSLGRGHAGGSPEAVPATVQASAPSSPPQTSGRQPAAPRSAQLPERPDNTLIRAQTDARSREILLAAARAHGGLRRLLAIRDWTIEATVSFYANGQTVQAETTTYIKQPDKLRIDRQIAGQRVTVATDGRVIWMRAAGQTLPLPEDKLAQLKRQLAGERGPLQLFRALSDPSYHFAYLKTVRVREGERSAQVIQMSAPGRPATRLYFDAQTHRLIRQDSDGPAGTVSVRMSDFRPVSGIWVAFHSQTYLQGKLALVMIVRRLVLNSDLKDDLFAKPPE